MYLIEARRILRVPSTLMKAEIPWDHNAVVQHRQLSTVTMTSPVTVDEALRGRNTGWFADKGIIKVNAILILTLVSGYANG